MDIDVERAVDDALRAAAENDEDRRWELVGRLHVHGGRRALEVASRLRDHPGAAHRALAADILGQLGAGPGRSAADGPFRDEALALLLAMAETEQDPAVLNPIAVGFGHIGDERCLEPLARMRTHADAGVRSGVVFGLLRRPETPALDMLITLSADPEPEVRDWATFGLAESEHDVPRLRDALAARLGDDDPETRAEAIHGLAARGDARAIEPLLGTLRSPRAAGDLVVLTEALYALAATTADPRLRPHLEADRDRRLAADPDDDLPEELLAALGRYTPPVAGLDT
jgi:HEAT repeat protein